MAYTVSPREMTAVRRLLMAEPEPAALLPRPATDALTELIGCDGFGACEADNTGLMLRHVDLPHLYDGDPQVCDGPLPTGIVHLAFLRRTDADYHPASYDTLWSGFGIGGDRVRQVYFDRSRKSGRPFGQREVALLTMVEPALGRLLRAAAPDVDGAVVLTPAERRVLALVAKGATNREVAECLFVSVATVRKHLENAYRRLGVTNRTAAVMTLRSSA